MKAYVQYGCGYSCPDGWVNFDSSPTLRFERLPLIGRLYTKNAERFPAGVRYGDVLRGLPVASDSCAAVYASHVLEHLALTDCKAALTETLRILEPGGIFRAVVPDLSVYADRYVAAIRRGDANASHEFMSQTNLGASERATAPLSRAAKIFGHSAHLWMWDEHSLSAEVLNAGFAKVRRAELGDSADPMFRLVEDPERFVDACALEARK